jgi:hypothetical protein
VPEEFCFGLSGLAWRLRVSAPDEQERGLLSGRVAGEVFQGGGVTGGVAG